MREGEKRNQSHKESRMSATGASMSEKLMSEGLHSRTTAGSASRDVFMSSEG